MTDDYRRTDSVSELVEIIHQVRRRWRVKLALRGALGVVGLGALVLLVSAYGLESWRFTAGAIITFRVLVGVALLGLIGYLLVRPLMRQATDEQVALYLEEHEPSLQAAIISAVEAGNGGSGSPFSATLVRRLVESAIEKARAVDSGRRVERAPVRRYVDDARSHQPRGRRDLHARPGLPAPRALGAAHCFARCRSRGAVQHRGDAGEQNRGARCGSGDYCEAVRVRFGAGLTDDAEVSRGRRMSGCRSCATKTAPMKGCCSISRRRWNTSSKPTASIRSTTTSRSSTFRTCSASSSNTISRRTPALPPQKVEDGGDIAVLKGTEVRVRAVPTMGTARRSDRARRQGSIGTGAGCRGRIAGAAGWGIQGRAGRLLSHRARRTVGRAHDGIAAVHDRCA